jgi:hypothetical protein
MREGKLVQAERNLRKSVDAQRFYAERMSDDFYLGTLFAHSACLVQLGRLKEAVPGIEETLAIQSHRFGEDSDDANESRDILNGVLTRLGEPSQSPSPYPND